jgi:hypothetical protein
MRPRDQVGQALALVAVPSRSGLLQRPVRIHTDREVGQRGYALDVEAGARGKCPVRGEAEDLVRPQWRGRRHAGRRAGGRSRRGREVPGVLAVAEEAGGRRHVHVALPPGTQGLVLRPMRGGVAGTERIGGATVQGQPTDRDGQDQRHAERTQAHDANGTHPQPMAAPAVPGPVTDGPRCPGLGRFGSSPGRVGWNRRRSGSGRLVVDLVHGVQSTAGGRIGQGGSAAV